MILLSLSIILQPWLCCLEKEEAIENIPEQCRKIILISPMCQAISTTQCTVPDYLLDTMQCFTLFTWYSAVYQGYNAIQCSFSRKNTRKIGQILAKKLTLIYFIYFRKIKENFRKNRQFFKRYDVQNWNEGKIRECRKKMVKKMKEVSRKIYKKGCTVPGY